MFFKTFYFALQLFSVAFHEPKVINQAKLISHSLRSVKSEAKSMAKKKYFIVSFYIKKSSFSKLLDNICAKKSRSRCFLLRPSRFIELEWLWKEKESQESESKRNRCCLIFMYKPSFFSVTQYTVDVNGIKLAKKAMMLLIFHCEMTHKR